ncbi:MAG TPA: alpha/beta hydrolase [Acidisarcina sp.]
MNQCLAALLLFALPCFLAAAQTAPAGTMSPVARPVSGTEAWGAQHRGLFTVKVSGQGPAVILIPGLSSSGDTWNGTVDHLKGHYQCHVLNLAGFAGVPAWSDVDKGNFLHAVEDELAVYIQSNKLVSPVIIGHSLGGTLTLEFAERYADLPGRLVIVDSLPFLSGVWLQAGSVKEADPIATNMKLQIKGESHDQYLQFVKSGASTRPMVTSDADYALVNEWAAASDQSTTAEALYELLTTDARADLGRIRGDVLVLATWAGFPGATSQQIESVYRGQYTGTKKLQLVMADNERHFIMLDNPGWFFSQIDPFLAAPAGGSTTGKLSSPPPVTTAH